MCMCMRERERVCGGGVEGVGEWRGGSECVVHDLFLTKIYLLQLYYM